MFPVAVGVALTVDPVEELNPPEAPVVHVYVLAPLPVNVNELPKHKVLEDVIEGTGNGFTKTCVVAVVAHPCPSVAVTV